MALCWPLQMPPTPKSVLISLADNANDQGHCWPSIATIAERTCFSERAVQGAIKWLQEYGLLTADRSNGRHTRYWLTPSEFAGDPRISCTPQEVHPAGGASVPPQEVRQPPQMPRQPPQEVPSNHQEPKRTVRSNRKKEANVPDVIVPDWLPADAWSNWVTHRHSIRKPLSDLAAKLCIDELESLRSNGFDPKKIINTSILNGWQGLFEPKQSGAKGGTTTGPGNKQQQLEDRNKRVADDWIAQQSAASQRQL